MATPARDVTRKRIRRIVFVSPPLSLEERYGDLAGAGSSMPSLGLLMLGAVARRAGYEPFVIEAAAENLSLRQVMDRVARIAPDMVGITATTLSIFNAHTVAEAVKKLDPGIVTVVGGPHVSAVPAETLRRFPQFDMAAIGEGEDTLVALLSALNGGGELPAVAGLALRDGENILITEKRPLIKDLDTLPFPAWDLLPGFPGTYRPTPFRHLQLPAAPLVTSRGCPNNCTFCDRTLFGRTCRLFSADYVVEMIRELVEKHGVRELVFEDDTFTLRKQRVVEICRALTTSGWDLTWTCLGRVDTVDPDLLAVMHRAGCWQIAYGIESGAQEILDLVEKKVRLERASQALAWTRKAGILTKGFFILGFPTETIATMERTIGFAKREALDDISVFKLTPLPGSRIHETASEFGRFDDDWRKMNLLDTVFVPNDLTQKELEDTARRMLKEFYLRPRTVFSYVKRVLKHPSLIPAVILGFGAFLKSIRG
jgi:anaerobic magnesium-protoporphyrin IX monomethyl ester cyclase